MCSHLANMRENVVGQRMSRLMEQWLGATAPNSMMRWIVGKALTKEQVLQQPSQHYVIMNVVFDYNWLTFVPEPLPPSVVRKDSCVLVGLPELQPSSPGEYKHMAIIVLNGMTYCRIVTFSQREIDWQVQNNTWIAADASWEEMRDDMLADCALESSIFACFPQIRWQNIDKQLDFILDSEAFKTFLPLALKIQTKKPLHLSHVVVIQFEFGCELGKIKRLVNYKVMAVKDLLNDMEQSGNFNSEMMAQHRNKELNLSLHQDPPYRLVMRTVFLNTTTAMKYATMRVRRCTISLPTQDQMFEANMIPGLDLKAKQDFARVQELKLPSVKSPEIN